MLSIFRAMHFSVAVNTWWIDVVVGIKPMWYRSSVVLECKCRNRHLVVTCEWGFLVSTTLLLSIDKSIHAHSSIEVAY